MEPFRQFVLKVHSRCDLACDHCYIYFGHDSGWHARPKVMTEETARQIGSRIAEHARKHRLPSAHVVLHGGEPLLAGVAQLRRIIDALHAELDGVCGLDIRIHTNGVRLDDSLCDLFAATGVRVGISLDGDRAGNDRHRRYANGSSSYDQVIRAVDRLRADKYRHLFLGILCTVDVLNDPIATYEALVALDPPRIDFLIPHATWDEPPPRPAGQVTAYADWLSAIFQRWNADGRPVRVRLFDSIIRTSRGADSLTEAIGLQPSNLVVIETDGTYEQADSLKASYAGASVTDLSVGRDSLDEVARHSGIQARQQGLAGLCQQCRDCPVVTSCGGGLYAHRYKSNNGFDNPSVYCADLMELINNIRNETAAERDQDSATTHSLTNADFDELAHGYGSAAVIGQLRQSQHTFVRALLAAFFDTACTTAGAAAVAAGLPDAWKLLTRIDQECPAGLGEVLSYPFIRAWLVPALQRLRSAQAGSDADLDYLGSVAVAAAIRSGLDGSATIGVRDGYLYLPALGRLKIAGSADSGPALVEVTATGDVYVRTGATRWQAAWTELDGLVVESDESGDWEPVRQLTAPGISVLLEDLDPYRDCYGAPVAPRMNGAEFAEFDRTFNAAWTLINEQYPAYAAGLAAGLTALVPLVRAANGRDSSVTARNAFGAIAAAPATDPATLALLLIHEFQHVKLGAILDLYDLFDPADTRLFHAPWRPDLRPLEGLLQGTYAHVGVSDFWRIRQRAGGVAADSAATRYSYWREQTSQAIDDLAGSGALTPLGVRLVAAMRATVDSWSAAAGPAGALVELP